MRYAGYWYDAELGWYWVGVRYYDPALGRWLAPDSSQQDGVRTYVYVGDDPIDVADPSGHGGVCDEAIGPEVEGCGGGDVGGPGEGDDEGGGGVTVAPPVQPPTVPLPPLLPPMPVPPAPAPTPGPGPHQPPGTPTPGPGDMTIYRQTDRPNRPQSVALRRVQDYATGLSFSLIKPAGPYIQYSVNTLRAAGYVVREDGGLLVTVLFNDDLTRDYHPDGTFPQGMSPCICQTMGRGDSGTTPSSRRSRKAVSRQKRADFSTFMNDS